MGDSDHYSTKNPHGPYGKYRERPQETKKQPYLEGWADKKTIDQWSEYSRKHSDDPKIKTK